LEKRRLTLAFAIEQGKRFLRPFALGYRCFRAYPKIKFMACESHALKQCYDFCCAYCRILGYAPILSQSGNSSNAQINASCGIRF
jgi:hypothetical protein